MSAWTQEISSATEMKCNRITLLRGQAVKNTLMINQVGVKAECTSGCSSGQVHFVVCIDRHIRVEETFYNRLSKCGMNVILQGCIRSTPQSVVRQHLVPITFPYRSEQPCVSLSLPSSLHSLLQHTQRYAPNSRLTPDPNVLSAASGVTLRFLAVDAWNAGGMALAANVPEIPNSN